MGYRCPMPGTVRASVLFTLTVIISSLSPAHVGRAQSAPPPLSPWRGLVDHVGANLSGSSGYASADLTDKSISADGRYVVFSSQANDLVPNDNNWADDVFLRDRLTGITTRVSVADDGSEAVDGLSQGGSISADGRHVAFQSGASNLVPGDTNAWWDVFVRDLDTNHTVRVSVATDGTQSDADSYFPSLSPDGRFVAFVSTGSTLAPGQQQYQPGQVYLHDRDADGNGIFDEPGGIATSLLSLSSTGERADDWCRNVRVSADGRIVMFESQATNLFYDVMLDGTNHLYVHDRQSGQTTMIDRAVTGGPSAYGVDYESSDMSDDGRFITYTTMSQDIVPFDMNWNSQVIRHDRADGTANANVLVTRLPDGTVGDGTGYFTSVSANGRYVAFQSTASNLATPVPEPGHGSIVVRDMAEGTFTRVDVLSDGTGFNHWYPYNPSISADGTAVAFSSDAQNTGVPGYPWGSTQHAFAVTGFAASPASASYLMEGGAGSIEVNTLPMSGWNAVSLDPWIVLMDGAGFGAGPRTVTFIVDSNGPGIVRDGRIQLGSMVIPIHQEGDGDTTPPVITPVVTGTQTNGWYTSDIALHWDITDPESVFVVDEGCYDLTFTTDFMDAAPYCRATSHGGTNFSQLHLRRDTTAPVISITAPAATTYPLLFTFAPSFSCTDNGGSGVASCTISAPMDTTTPGRKLFTVTSTDAVGNSSSKSVEYTVGTGVCVAANDSLEAWFRFEGDGADQYGLYAAPVPAVQVHYDPAIAGLGLHGQGDMYPQADDPGGDRLRMGQGLTISAWVASGGPATSSATIVASPGQYRIAVFPDMSLRWAFNGPAGFTWVDTGVKLPRRADIFTHIAVTYDAGLVKTYVNGRQVHTRQLDAPVATPPGPQSLTIAGRADEYTPFFGTIDELQIYAAPLADAEVEAIALAGDGSLCAPQTTTLTLVAPATIGYMGQAAVSAQLLDEAGTPLAGKRVVIYTYFSPDGMATGGMGAVTDANGKADAVIQLYSNSVPGTYSNGIKAFFDGDVHYQWSYASAATSVVRGTPAITWPDPGAITYGTALGAGQLNAAASTAGTFAYSPAAGTTLAAGEQTLSVTFTPDDLTNWQPVTVTTTIQVNKATPAVSLTVGTYTYDKLAHPATVTVTGVDGEALSPVQVYYNGSQSAPVNAGSYWVSAYYAGSANYTAASKTSSTQLVIRKYVPTVDMFGGPYTYDGQQHYPTIYVRGAGGDYLYPFGYFFDGWTYTIPVNAGTHTVQVQYNGDSNYEAIRIEDLSFVINKATPSIWIYDTNRFYDGTPQSATGWASGVGSVSLTPVVVTYSGSTTPPANVGSYALVARYDGSANYNAVSATATMNILKGTPAVTWANPAGIVYGTPLGATQLNATTGVAGTFYYAQPAGTVLPAGSHTLSVLFVPTDQSNWSSVNRSVTLSVAKATPAVAWTTPADMVYGMPLGADQLNATSSVAGSFAYSPAADIVLSAGTATLSATFTPADPANYSGASASVTVTVLKATPVITWPVPSSIVYGTSLGVLQLNAAASTSGTLAYSPAAGAVLAAGAHTLSVAFTPADASNYNSATASVALDVLKATPVVTWVQPAEVTYGTPLSALQLNLSSSVPGTYEFSPAPGTILPAGTNTLSVVFTPEDANNYNTATASAVLNVLKATPIVDWVAPADITYGMPLGSAQLRATASTAGTFTYAPAAGTILPAGSHTLSVTFTPDDAANYTGAGASVTLNVTKAGTALTWGSPAAIVYGTPLTAAQLNATASVPGTFTYSPAPGAVLPAGSAVLSVTFTPADTTNYTGSSASTTLTIVRAPLTVAAADATKPFGQPLPAFTSLFGGFVNGEGPASLAGTVAYATTATVTSPVGTYALTPSGVSSPNYTITFVSGTLTVVRAATVVTASASPSPSGVDQPVTFSANVTLAAPGLGSPAGAIQFFDGGTLIGSVAVSGGPASLTTAGLPAGTHTLTATYSGDANFAGSASTATFTVNTAASSSTTVVSSSLNPSNSGQTVTFNAAVSGPAGTISGSVEFYDGATLLGTAPIVGTTASFTTAALAVGGHAITARFGGNASVPPSISPAFAHTVQAPGAKPKATTTTVAASPAPVTLGGEAALTATVTGSQNRTPTGTVLFMANGTVIGTATLTATGSTTAAATLRISTLPHGTHAIGAVYLADSGYRASAGTVRLTIN